MQPFSLEKALEAATLLTLATSQKEKAFAASCLSPPVSTRGKTEAFDTVTTGLVPEQEKGLRRLLPIATGLVPVINQSIQLANLA